MTFLVYNVTGMCACIVGNIHCYSFFHMDIHVSFEAVSDPRVEVKI